MAKGVAVGHGAKVTASCFGRWSIGGRR